MPKSPRSPHAADLSPSVHQRLNTYAIAAGAAGVSLLALTPTADAKIVYTATNQTISTTNGVQIDLNGDGKVDFGFGATFHATSFGEYQEGALFALASWHPNQILGGREQGYNLGFALSAGAVIGPTRTFVAGRADMAFGAYDGSTGVCGGPWDNVKHHYLGLKFVIDGQYHYGWARLDATCLKNGENTAVLTGYAYETIPYKPISAGKISGPEEESGEGAVAPDAANANPVSKSPTRASLGTLALGARRD
jgi:hypothetical protein